MAPDVSKLLISTRPLKQNHLQNELHKLPVYYLQLLKHEEQTQFLNNFLKYLGEMKKASLDDALMEDLSDILNKFPIKKKKDITFENFGKLKEELESLSFVEYAKKRLSHWRKSIFAKDNKFHGNPLNL